MAHNDADVIIIGAGNAAFSAAHAARERGRSVIVLESAPQDEAGGNSFYTAGATRIAHNGIDELKEFIVPDERHEKSVAPPYSTDDYIADMERVTEGRNDDEMTRIVAEEAQNTVRWLSDLGLKYRLMYERQAYDRPDGSYLFWGGLHIGNVDGGAGLIKDHLAVAERLGTEVRYENRVTDLLMEDGTVRGVVVETPAGVTELYGESVIIASGGFEANADMRAEYLGEQWRHAKVRGTPENTGVLLNRAIEKGAAVNGDCSTCHSVQWDAFLEDNEGNRELTNRLTRQSYHLGVIVNKNGERFLDEGADFRNYTYAKYGREILKQPDSVSWQIFDAGLRPLLRTEEYDMPGISVVQANSIAELAQLAGINEPTLVKTIGDYNQSIDDTPEFDLTIKDGRRANTDPVKSNWARALVEPPFYAYGVTCGITFTFGGLKGDENGRVLRKDGSVMPGLFACGEALGGLFSSNYPGGSGLAAGMVFGRRAGAAA